MKSASSPLVFVFALLASEACDDTSSAIKDPAADAGGRLDSGVAIPDGAADGAPRDCFENPKTHAEIINACTTATRIPKDPSLPMLLADGGLPPLN